MKFNKILELNIMKKLQFLIIVIFLANPFFSPTYSQAVSEKSPAAGSDIQPKITIPIWPGAAPGSEDWIVEEKETQSSGHITVINVTKPTLTVYLPEPSKATGTGVIVAPGGAFVALAIEHEGRAVARWLAERGIAAFVLKYRTQPGGREALKTNQINLDELGKFGIADGIQALKVVREHAAEWGIKPNRVGFLGFSAGAAVTSAVLLQDEPSARPDFAAPIYGGPFGTMPNIPTNLPPVFLAWAQDDSLANNFAMRFYQALKAAENNPEVHIFNSGGHGFGLQKRGTSSDHWIDMYYFWMEAQGLTKRAQ